MAAKSNCLTPLIQMTTLLVVALYSKTTGKNAKHAAITDSSTIGAISDLGMQLFEHHDIPEATSLFLTKQNMVAVANVTVLPHINVLSPCIPL